MDFESLAAGRIIPPWTPTVVGSMDTSQFDLEFTSMLPVGEYLFFYSTLLFLYSVSLYLMFTLSSLSPPFFSHLLSSSPMPSCFLPFLLLLRFIYPCFIHIASIINSFIHAFFFMFLFLFFINKLPTLTSHFKSLLLQCPLTYAMRTSDP